MGQIVFQANLGGAVNLIGPNIATTLNLTLPSADGTAGQALQTNGSGVLSFATLGVAAGGTNLTSFTSGDMMYASGSTTLSKLGIGTSGQILTSSGTAPQWSTLSSAAVTTFSAGTTGFTPSTATSGAITLAGTLGTANGGTGLTSFTANGVVYASSTSALTTGSALTFDGTTFATTGFGRFGNGGRIEGAGSALAGTGVGAEIFASGGVAYYTSYDRTGAAYSPLISIAGSYQAWNVGGEQMRLTSTGLGIGTSSPAYKLDVAGPINIQGTSTFPVTGMMLRSGDNQLKILGGSAGIVFGAPSGASSYATIDSSGNLGIGTSSPSASAILDAQSTTKGVRFPNMTTTQKNAISSPAAGLVVFDTTLAKLCVYSGAAWQTITSV